MTLTGTEAYVAGSGYTIHNPHDGSVIAQFPEWYWRIVYQQRPEPKYTDKWLETEIRKLDERFPAVENAGNTEA